MKKILLLSFTLFAALYAEDSALSSSNYSDVPSEYEVKRQLVVNNRPLAKINGKIISLIDVVKRLNLNLFYYDANLTLTPIEKYQHYSAHWETTLNEMIHDQLILLDAEQKEINISSGKVREKFEDRFGPHVMANLEKVDLSYEEALEIIRTDLTIQELQGINVQAKIFQIVTPKLIKEAYLTYLAQNPPEELCTYQFLSIRTQDSTLAEDIAQKASQYLNAEFQTLQDLADRLSEENFAEVKISVSGELSTQKDKLSNQHRLALESLSPNTFSAPITQVSRYDNSKVLRIFHLKDLSTTSPSSFSEMQDKLKQDLLNTAFEAERDVYIQSLKKKFSYDNHNPRFTLPDDYQPFSLS